MNIEGLDVILAKEEVVATQSAEALLERPREVDDAYKVHVRTYVPLHTGRGESSFSVEEFSRSLIRQTKEKQAPRGYLTADFGYGKTSTALYLWSQAQASNLVAVPPFQLNRLHSLVVATYGWMDYVLSLSRPGLCAEAKAIYAAFADRSLRQMATESSADLQVLHQWLSDGRLTLDLTAPDYIHFFEQMTELAQRAGFDGLVVFADEVQQYIEPEVKSGAKDPIAPLFNIIQGLATRRGHLAFGLILVIPRKDLALIMDQRGDLLDRMRDLALDLGAIYDQTFPSRLWNRLSKEFHFADRADAMVYPETLTALGQISVRDDLSNGPRTVVNAFRRIARRYLEQSSCSPYSPIDLVNDFLGGIIRFDGVKRLQEVTTPALGHSLVQGRPDREEAVKLAAAFPEGGATRSMQKDFQDRLHVGFLEAFDDLLQGGQGELVIRVGDVSNPGITLLGLERGETKTDWLTLTVRDFSRTYFESAERTTQRAVEGFLDLLASQVFRAGQWRVVERLAARLSQNAGLVLEGAFPSTARRFPERRIHVRVLVEDEPVKDANPLGEVVIEIRLCRYLDWDEDTRRQYVEAAALDPESHTARFTLNLMSRSGTGVSRELDEAIGRIVSPYKITPLLLLTLYAAMDEKRGAHQIPKEDDQFIQYQFQPALLDNALVELLRPEVGVAFDAAGPRLVEIIVGRLLESRYGDNYCTLIAVSNWQSSLQKYINALCRLAALQDRQGQLLVEGLKEDIAELFTLTNTGLDSFMANFPSLIALVRDFPSRRQSGQGETGAVRFHLHPLEVQIRSWLQSSPDVTTIKVSGQSQSVHRLPTGQVYSRASEMGYKDDEIAVLIEVMQTRGLVEQDQKGNLVEAVRQVPSIEEVAEAVDELVSNVSYLQAAFPQAVDFQRLAEEAQRYAAKVDELRAAPDETTLVSLRRTVVTRLRDVKATAESRQAELRQKTQELLQRLPGLEGQRRSTLDNPVAGVKYADQVNNLRIRLLRTYTQFGNRVDELRQKLGAVERVLADAHLSLSDLAKQAAAVRELEQDVQVVHKSSEALAMQYHQFTDWCRLVEDGASTFNDLQMMGESAASVMGDFEKLDQDIRGDISAHALDALPHVVTYTARLNELRVQVRRLRDEAIGAFNDLQNRYRDEITRAINYPRDRLGEPLLYSPLDPAGIYLQLYRRVTAVLGDIVARMQQFRADRLAGVQNILHTPLLADLTPRERERIERQGHELETALSQVGDALVQAQQRSADVDVIRDFPQGPNGAFRMLLVELRNLYEQLDGARQRLDAVTATLRKVELSAGEAQVWKALEKVAPGGEFSDLSTLRAQTSKLDDESIWSAIRGLWEKQRVQVQVRPVRYEEE